MQPLQPHIEKELVHEVYFDTDKFDINTLGEDEKEAGQVDHAGIFVQDDHAARTHHGTD